jgi:hypothetical protein
MKKKTKTETLSNTFLIPSQESNCFLNEATRAEDLMFEKLPMLHFENAEGAIIVDKQAEMRRKPRKIMYAKTVPFGAHI